MCDKEKDREKEVSLEELAKVTGGSGLRKTVKEETYDITDDTKKKV